MYSLNKKIIIKGKIIALTGLHIGGTNSAMSIGGPDKSVIRNPIDNKPYIPGSSLKGKMRTLTELRDGNIGEGFRNTNIDHGPSMDFTKISAKLFGSAQKEENRSNQRPSKIIVRDCKLLTDESVFSNTDLPYTESKTEIVIDRITSAANPRQIERVPAGAAFELGLVLNIYAEDDEDELLRATYQALQLVQDDYLGGNGSRGSGQVKFEITSVLVRTAQYYLGEGQESAYEGNISVPPALQPLVYES
ncbi:MAG: type III-A CRISPR-associated RAMP protein Csm3 [Bacteroidia bacterium]